jgi:hypothetical protein
MNQLNVIPNRDMMNCFGSRKTGEDKNEEHVKKNKNPSRPLPSPTRGTLGKGET